MNPLLNRRLSRTFSLFCLNWARALHFSDDKSDRNDFPDLDPRVQVPFVRLLLEACADGRDLNDAQRTAVIATTLDIVERIRQEVRIVDFWKNQDRRELLTKRIVRDLDASGVCPPGKERDIAQRLVALARENHENLVRP